MQTWSADTGLLALRLTSGLAESSQKANSSGFANHVPMLTIEISSAITASRSTMRVKARSQTVSNGSNVNSVRSGITLTAKQYTESMEISIKFSTKKVSSTSALLAETRSKGALPQLQSLTSNSRRATLSLLSTMMNRMIARKMRLIVCRRAARQRSILIKRCLSPRFVNNRRLLQLLRTEKTKREKLTLNSRLKSKAKSSFPPLKPAARELPDTQDHLRWQFLKSHESFDNATWNDN